MNLIAVTSGKGGTGKSCIAAYTGVAMSEAGMRTLLVEQGLDGRSLDLITAAQNRAVFDLDDLLEGRCEDEKAIVPASYTDNLCLIPAGAGLYRPDGEGAFPALLKRMRRRFEYILVDGPDFSTVPSTLFDTIILVTTPDTLSVRACQNRARLLFESGAENLRLVINNVPAQIMPIHGIEDFDDLVNLVGVQLLGVIPHSPKLAYASNNAQMLDEESLTIQVFDNLAARLRGQQRPLLIR